MPGRSPRFWLVVAGIVLLGAAGFSLMQGGATTPPAFGRVGPLPTNSVFSGPDRDVSCTVELWEPGASEACATLLPTLAPQERTLGRPLDVGPIDVALDHLGPYRVRIGEAILVRGLIQDMVLTIRNTADGTYAAPFFMLELEDAVTGKTLPRNLYEKGVVDGLQRVNVYLTFDLQSYEPGAVVQVDRVSVH